MRKHDEGGSRRRRRRVGWTIGIGVALGGAIGIAIGLLSPTTAKVASVATPTSTPITTTPTTLTTGTVPSSPPSPSDFQFQAGLPDALSQLGCQNPDGTTEWEATAWPYLPGGPSSAGSYPSNPPTKMITASHFAQSCGAGNSMVIETSRGPVTGTLAYNDPTHDLAGYDITPLSEEPLPLATATSAAYVGQEVALVGFPGGNSNPALNATQFCYGRVSGLNQTETLDDVGFTETLTETLTDAITVTSLSCPPQPGMSGGVAFDTSGNVVGVIEGTNGQQAVLTPVQDLPP